MKPLFPPTLGMYCVPTALEIITGEDPESVLFPALNRHSPDRMTLTGEVGGEHISAATKALEQLGYAVRRYRGDRLKNASVAQWAETYPDRTILAVCENHCIVMRHGKVYDSWEPLGVTGSSHPFHDAPVHWAALVEKN